MLLHVAVKLGKILKIDISFVTEPIAAQLSAFLKYSVVTCPQLDDVAYVVKRRECVIAVGPSLAPSV